MVKKRKTEKAATKTRSTGGSKYTALTEKTPELRSYSV